MSRLTRELVNEMVKFGPNAVTHLEFITTLEWIRAADEALERIGDVAAEGTLGPDSTRILTIARAARLKVTP